MCRQSAKPDLQHVQITLRDGASCLQLRVLLVQSLLQALYFGYGALARTGHCQGSPKPISMHPATPTLPWRPISSVYDDGPGQGYASLNPCVKQVCFA